ncbi:hypothetical protein EVAR_53787_1 [Eumeta japonica]|uniref:Uncharacterized protein n=1 Tax=Eumeta variegata TaxID=151549 RepID=A0A4C1XV66_EUMVA|nr:hypothetical protein EVAR_53787_1 [Eumeta japonica]
MTSFTPASRVAITMAPKWFMTALSTISRSQLFRPRKPSTKTDAIVFTLLFASAPSRLASFSLRPLAASRVVVMTTSLPNSNCFTTHVVFPQSGTPLIHVISGTTQSFQASLEALRL